MPSCPNWFSPQQEMLPFTNSAQLCRRPVTIATVLTIGFGVESLDISAACTTTGDVEGFAAVLLPNSPSLLSPQQRAVPSTMIAQEWPSPAAMPTAGTISEILLVSTLTGVGCDKVLPLPSWPDELAPQQTAKPKTWSAQV